MSVSKESNFLPGPTDIEDGSLAQPSGSGEFQTDRVLTIMAGHAVHDTYTGFLPPMLPLFIERFALSRTEAGMLSIFMSAPSILQPVIGFLADRISLKALVILGPGLSAVMMSLLGIAPAYWVMAMFLLVVGFSSAGFHSTAPVMIGKLSGVNLGRGMGFWMVGGELGRTLGPIVIVTALQVVSLENTPWLMFGGLLTSFIVYLRLRDIPEQRASQTAELAWRSAFDSLRPILLPLVGIVFTRAFLLPAVTTYLPTYLTDEGAELWFAGLALAILEVAGVAGAMLGGTLSDRLGRRRVISIGMLSAPILVFAFVALEGWAQIVALPLIGLTSLSIAPVLMALVQETAPENRALANGIYLAMSFVFRSIAVVILGTIGDRYGLSVAFQFSAVLMLLGLIFVPFLPKRNAQVSSV